MKKRLTILNANIVENKLVLIANESIQALIPREQILVDSEQFAFIYLMEDKDDYTYIVLHEQIWPLLKTSQKQKLPVCVTFKQEQLELINFHAEFEDVISNIQGNFNYGNELVTKVEGIFLP
ncbi:MAG: hypothetical protein K6T88_16955 [Bacillus sp. (in: Bacteria)]|nr:hypothetical protein [Bacillus sp. (in: firmicutes)]